MRSTFIWYSIASNDTFSCCYFNTLVLSSSASLFAWYSEYVSSDCSSSSAGYSLTTLFLATTTLCVGGMTWGKETLWESLDDIGTYWPNLPFLTVYYWPSLSSSVSTNRMPAEALESSIRKVSWDGFCPKPENGFYLIFSVPVKV